jgi:ribosome-associated protein
MEFNLGKHEFIELNKLLKLLSMVESGGEANERITQGEVLVNNAVEIQKRKKLRIGDSVEFQGRNIVICQ